MLYFAPSLIARATRDMSEGSTRTYEFSRPAIRDTEISKLFRELFITVTRGTKQEAAFHGEELILMLMPAVMREQIGGNRSGSIPQGTAAQLSQETSGNPNLKPEQADTYTFGVNFAPRWIPHLTGSVDYYHIQIKDEIGVIPYLLVLSNCADTGNPLYCGQIKRQPKTPIHLAFSFDEEVGCHGARRLIEDLDQSGLKPALCVVGEPSGMQPILAHKGRLALRVIARGAPGHSSDPAGGV